MTAANSTAKDGIFKATWYFLFGRKAEVNVFQTDLEKFKSGKQEVSDFFYKVLLFIATTLAIGLALQNAMYGAELGTFWLAIIVTSCLFFMGDFALIAFAYWSLPKFLTKILSIISLIGFAVLSVYAAMALTLTMSHAKDNYMVELTQTQISNAIKEKDELGPSWKTRKKELGRKISRLKAELKEMTEDDGGVISNSGSVPVLIAKVFKLSTEVVKFYTRLTWAVVFVVGSITLGGMLATMYCPFLLDLRSKHLAKRDVNQKQGEVDYNVKLQSVPTPNRTGGTTKASSGADYTEPKYKTVLGDILAGTVRPSVRGIKPRHSLGTDQAGQMLQRMSAEGYLKKGKNGYSLIKTA